MANNQKEDPAQNTKIISIGNNENNKNKLSMWEIIIGAAGVIGSIAAVIALQPIFFPPSPPSPVATPPVPAAPVERVVDWRICEGQFENSCPAHDGYFECYKGIENYAKARCSKFEFTNLGSSSGNRCGYTIYALRCTNPH